RSCQQVEDYLRQMRPQLQSDARSFEVVDILLAAPAPSRLAQPVGKLMLNAGIDLLPDWAQAMLGLQQGPLQRRMIRLGL
ncbi:oxygenase MpaB family protein, partial [Pantoea sp. SIMBA_072]